jgi:NAD(P)-dependent dehydrogenase (short-subunit alcohol dehydrogenase family)
MSEKPIAIVTGVGPGTGSAIVQRFAAGGFRVVAMARSPDRIRDAAVPFLWTVRSGLDGPVARTEMLLILLDEANRSPQGRHCRSPDGGQLPSRACRGRRDTRQRHRVA